MPLIKNARVPGGVWGRSGQGQVVITEIRKSHLEMFVPVKYTDGFTSLGQYNV